MKKNILRKGLVFGIIMLFIGTSIVPIISGYNQWTIKTGYLSNKNEPLNSKYNDEYITLISDGLLDRVFEVDSSGNIIWVKTDLYVPQDVKRISNGNTLICEPYKRRVIEVDVTGDIVWELSNLGSPMDAERLASGNTLIAEYSGGRVIEVDTSGNIVDILMQNTSANYIDVERLDNGNTLIIDDTTDNIYELNPSHEIVWQLNIDNNPVDIERLSNGNSLITNQGRKKVIEVDSLGNIIWEISNLIEPWDAERLDNGNTLIADFSRVIEVNTDGDIVWEYTDVEWASNVERVKNSHPAYPPIINGPSRGKLGIEYDYILNSIDLDGDDVKYIINWGDTNANTTDFNPSGTYITVSHTWATKGIYMIIAKAEDEFGLISPETTKAIIIPRNKAIDLSLYYLLENHHFLFRLLQLLFQR